MNRLKIIANHVHNNRYILLAVALLLLSGLAGCGGTYGRLQRDPAVYRAFESNQVRGEYKYYYNGVSFTHAIIGIDPRYQISSKLWREIEADTDDFKLRVTRIWEDYGYRTYGANILDPEGNKIGIFYSSIYVVTIKFIGENEIEVILDTPYLWGPDLGSFGGGDIRVP